jgi:hypothetical protein
MKVKNVFYNVFMGSGFVALSAYLPYELRENECAIFINKNRTSCKVLLSGGGLFYYRPTVGTLTPERIADIPKLLHGKTSLGFSEQSWGSLLREFKDLRRKVAA